MKEVTFDEVWNELKSNDTTGTFAKAEELSLVSVEAIEYAFNSGYAEAKAEFERPQGEWARHDEWRGGEYIGGFYHVNCPCEGGYYSKWEYNFCPNCGTAMQKGGKEE